MAETCCCKLCCKYLTYQIQLCLMYKYTVQFGLKNTTGMTHLKIALESSNNELPDDGDCSETCRSCFNVNFNVNFKVVFKTIRLCISW
jgi:hypothetical protein